MKWRTNEKNRKYCVICQYNNERDLKPINHGLFCRKHRDVWRRYSSGHIEEVRKRLTWFYDRKFILDCKLRDRNGPRSGENIFNKLTLLKEKIKKEKIKLMKCEWLRDIVNEAKIQRGFLNVV